MEPAELRKALEKFYWACMDGDPVEAYKAIDYVFSVGGGLNDIKESVRCVAEELFKMYEEELWKRGPKSAKVRCFPVIDALLYAIKSVMPKVKSRDVWVVVASTSPDYLRKDALKALLLLDGYEVIDAGVEVNPVKLVKLVRKVKPDFVVLFSPNPKEDTVAKDVVFMLKTFAREKAKIICAGSKSDLNEIISSLKP